MGKGKLLFDSLEGEGGLGSVCCWIGFSFMEIERAAAVAAGAPCPCLPWMAGGFEAATASRHETRQWMVGRRIGMGGRGGGGDMGVCAGQCQHGGRAGVTNDCAELRPSLERSCRVGKKGPTGYTYKFAFKHEAGEGQGG